MGQVHGKYSFNNDHGCTSGEAAQLYSNRSLNKSPYAYQLNEDLAWLCCQKAEI